MDMGTVMLMEEVMDMVILTELLNHQLPLLVSAFKKSQYWNNK
jgi:hypothetical protein